MGARQRLGDRPWRDVRRSRGTGARGGGERSGRIISVWDGTIAQSGRPVDFTSADFFRIQDGLGAEHWDTVDYVRLYESVGLLPDDINDG
jgi:hypothetical protein